jgi:hypothetical protein
MSSPEELLKLYQQQILSLYCKELEMLRHAVLVRKISYRQKGGNDYDEKRFRRPEEMITQYVREDGIKRNVLPSGGLQLGLELKYRVINHRHKYFCRLPTLSSNCL